MPSNLKRKRPGSLLTTPIKKRQSSPAENDFQNLSDGHEPEEHLSEGSSESDEHDEANSDIDVHPHRNEGEDDMDVGTDAEEQQRSGSLEAEGSRASTFQKPPTGGEVRAIREATDLFRSSSFKLQVRDAQPLKCLPSYR